MSEHRIIENLNNQRIAAVEQCFGSSGQPLALPGRFIIGEGVLTKMCRKKPKFRQFFLFTDILVYGNIITQGKKYNRQRMLSLVGIQLQSAEDDEKFHLRHGWHIISTVRSFTVFASTALEKEQWMSHLLKCINRIQQEVADKQSPDVDLCPVWVPDASAPVCMVCLKSTFTLVNRRHHCRKCGVVCCGACSPHHWLLPQQSSSPVRVCTPCYSKLCNPTEQSEKNLDSHSDEFPGSQTVLTESGIGKDLSDSSDITDEQECNGGITVEQRTSLFYED